MRFIADESCDFRVIRALRAAGHDVLAVIETAPGASDEVVIDMAARENRVFLTEDRDFGQLVYAATKSTPGVILLRFPSSRRTQLPGVILALIEQHSEKLANHFVVVQPGRVRFGAMPKD
jgi:predicted nuclease of predicted toxin-antitoxin system